MENFSEHIELEATVPDDYAGLRLDQALAKLFPQYSRSRLQTWLKDGQVLVDDKVLRSRDKVLGGELITINATLKTEAAWEPQPIDLNIIFEDDALIIVNKPIGLVTHPGAGNPAGTLVNALLHHTPELEKLPRAGLIHRLDKNTSGLLVIARTLEAHTHLVAQLQARTMGREYEAIVCGVMTAGGSVDAPIGRHPIQRKQMTVIESGKPAVTHYRVLQRFRQHTHIHVKLETGRTHQIRVHMAHIHYPILGDATYGQRLRLPPQCDEALKLALQQCKHQALHARRLQVEHPISGETLQWEAPLPEDLQQILALLEEDNERHST
ncbi:MAG: 23S rRNA pseudouridine(1911/1915/1917) synthase RluD [Legionellales bacterium]|nr:23S rRNA pseudouridine(1911/1915/1917) synthase RluD [Legionellales bacterium]|tara:strand:+ start:19612 stop:20583 length:972 start_codon:yes stop_codon:yes gene_type:complete